MTNEEDLNVLLRNCETVRALLRYLTANNFLPEDAEKLVMEDLARYTSFLDNHLYVVHVVPGRRFNYDEHLVPPRQVCFSEREAYLSSLAMSMSIGYADEQIADNILRMARLLQTRDLDRIPLEKLIKLVQRLHDQMGGYVQYNIYQVRVSMCTLASLEQRQNTLPEVIQMVLKRAEERSKA